MSEGILDLEVITGLESGQRKLLPPIESPLRGGDAQREFLNLVIDDPEKFCQKIRTWGMSGGSAPKIFEEPLAEDEFMQPTWKTEKIIASTWEELPLALAASPGLWARIHIELIEKQRIQGSFLARATRGKEPGDERVRRLLSKGTANEIDSCVRDVFRHMGGMPRVRGARTTYLDCPLARAWWRNYFAREAQRAFSQEGLDEKLSDAFRVHKVWEIFIEAMVSRLTVIGDQNLRPALSLHLGDVATRSNQKAAELREKAENIKTKQKESKAQAKMYRKEAQKLNKEAENLGDEEIHSSRRATKLKKAKRFEMKHTKSKARVDKYEKETQKLNKAAQEEVGRYKKEAQQMIHAIGRYTSMRALGYLSAQKIYATLKNEISRSISRS